MGAKLPDRYLLLCFSYIGVYVAELIQLNSRMRAVPRYLCPQFHPSEKIRWDSTGWSWMGPQVLDLQNSLSQDDAWSPRPSTDGRSACMDSVCMPIKYLITAVSCDRYPDIRGCFTHEEHA